jgi:hypothetical protein
MPCLRALATITGTTTSTYLDTRTIHTSRRYPDDRQRDVRTRCLAQRPQSLRPLARPDLPPTDLRAVDLTRIAAAAGFRVLDGLDDELVATNVPAHAETIDEPQLVP